MSTPDAGDLEAATRRVQELSEQVVTQAKQNGLAWLEGYERLLTSMLEFEEQAAKGTGADWATSLASTHANLVRQTSEVFLGRAAPAAQELTPRQHPSTGRHRWALSCARAVPFVLVPPWSTRAERDRNPLGGTGGSSAGIEDRNLALAAPGHRRCGRFPPFRRREEQRMRGDPTQ